VAATTSDHNRPTLPTTIKIAPTALRSTPEMAALTPNATMAPVAIIRMLIPIPIALLLLNVMLDVVPRFAAE
jgi:hypothetical protein